MRFVALQFDIIWEDKSANHRIIEQMLDDAAVPAGSFVLLPELGDTGFSFNLDAIVDDRTLPWARALARARGIWLQPGYAVRGDDGKGRNCAAIISPAGDVLGCYQKVHPFSFGRESEHFSGGDSLLLAALAEHAQAASHGSSTASTPLLTVAPLICYDLRFPEIWRLAARAGAEVFTIGASWPSARQHHWRQLAIARAIENQAYVVAVNRIGADPHLSYLGGSIIVSPMGEVLAEADDQPAVIAAEVDPAALRDWRAKFPALRDVHADLLGSIHIERAAIEPAAPRERSDSA